MSTIKEYVKMSVNGLINTKSDHLIMLDSLKTNKNVYHAVFVNDKPTTPETEEPGKKNNFYSNNSLITVKLTN